MLLEQCGVEVWTARDGITALTLAEEARLDLILLDIGLPKLDGYAVARALRQRQESSPLLVAVTGYGGRDDLLRCAEAGFDLHLLKPVDPTTLIQLPMLISDTGKLRQKSERLSTVTSAAMIGLLKQQLAMAVTFLDVAARTQSAETRARLLAKAVRACDRVEDQVRRFVEQADLIPDVLSLRYRISVVTKN
jgi:CheY-like chemotaxis protein